MKSIITLLFVIFCFSSNGQKIRYSDANTWSSGGYSLSSTRAMTSHWRYNGTATVGSHTYKILEGNYDFYSGGSWFSSLTFGRYIREDTLNQIVYISDGTTEDTLMNYRWHIGVIRNLGYQVDTLIAIDSTIINGLYHKIFTFGYQEPGGSCSGRYTMIEGVGSTRDPVFPIQTTFFLMCQDSVEMDCFTWNGFRPVIIKPGVFSNQCALGLSSLKKSSDISIYPNPAIDELNITSSEKITHATVFDIFGRTLQNIKQDSDHLNIDISGISTGVYFVKINDVSVRKFIKQ